MDLTVRIVSRNLTTTSNSETYGICMFFEETRVMQGPLAHFEWLKRCLVSSAELVKQGEPSGAHVDMWHLLSGWKSAIMDNGWDVIQMNQL